MTALMTWIGITLASASCSSPQQAGWWDAQVEASLPPETPAAAKLARIFADRFSADESKRATARKLLAELTWDESMREAAWAAYKASPAHEPLRREFEAKTVATRDRKSPYL